MYDGAAETIVVASKRAQTATAMNFIFVSAIGLFRSVKKKYKKKNVN